jgi:hypothetical protein
MGSENPVAVEQPFTVISHCIGHQNNPSVEKWAAVTPPPLV